MTAGTLSYLRWATTALYASALLGALIVPHEHSFLGGSCGCCHSAAGCESDESSTCHAGHHHGGHSHDHKHDCAHDHHSDAAPNPSEEAPDSSQDCPYCRFLAQPVQLAAPPAVLCAVAAVEEAPAVTAVVVERPLPATPPVRGPPAC